MESKIFSIPNISCDHCVMSIKRELSEIEGVSKVEGSADTKKNNSGMGCAGNP